MIESPVGSDVSGHGRSRKGREKEIQSPCREEEESESSSAKEDDVDSLERGSKSTPQRKTTRRRRNEKSPYSKEENKDFPEDDESTSEYAWIEDKKEHASIRGESRSKLAGESKRKKGSKGKTVRPKILNENENSENLERQTSAMEILTDCALKKEAEFGGKMERDDLKIKEESMEIDNNMREDALRNSKRRSEDKSFKRLVKSESEKNLLNTAEDQNIIERSENENIPIIESGKMENNFDLKKVKTENNNISESGLGSESELACMEHVVNILQQAAAIDAEKQRKSKEFPSSPSHGRSEIVSGIKTQDKERRKRKRERKKRRRHPSCSIPEASESENSTQSPFRKGRERSYSTVEFDKEKFDFVSDLSKFFMF